MPKTNHTTDFDALRSAGRSEIIELAHSRFRPAERESWRQRFLIRAACTEGADHIVVVTQVIGGEVDISARYLIPELAPSPSLVQRFGRCARYGGSAYVLVLDRGRDEKSAPPYAAEELEIAWAALETLQDVSVGIASLVTRPPPPLAVRGERCWNRRQCINEIQ